MDVIQENKMDFKDINEIKKAGFEGFLTFGELRKMIQSFLL